MADGSRQAIETLAVGDRLRRGGRILLMSRSWSAALCDVQGIHVTRGHWIRHQDRWVEAQNYPGARLIQTGPVPVWSLMTEHGVIACGRHVFADLLTMREVIPVDLHRNAQNMSFTTAAGRVGRQICTAKKEWRHADA